MRVVWSSQAARDLADAVEYLVERDASAARRLADDVLRVVDDLASGLIEGPAVELDGAAVRGWSMPPYRLYYKRSDDELWILRLYHQRRRPIS